MLHFGYNLDNFTILKCRDKFDLAMPTGNG